MELLYSGNFCNLRLQDYIFRLLRNLTACGGGKPEINLEKFETRWKLGGVLWVSQLESGDPAGFRAGPPGTTQPTLVFLVFSQVTVPPGMSLPVCYAGCNPR